MLKVRAAVTLAKIDKPKGERLSSGVRTTNEQARKGYTMPKITTGKVCNSQSYDALLYHQKRFISAILYDAFKVASGQKKPSFGFDSKTRAIEFLYSKKAYDYADFLGLNWASILPKIDKILTEVDTQE